MTDDRQITETDTKEATQPFAPLSIDWELYGQYLEDSDLSEEDKRACIEALWSIMVSFVDMGFRLAPLPEICGQVLPLEAASDKNDTAMINCKDSFNRSEKTADGHTLPSSGKESADDR
jgi:hypothetical protein